MASRGSDYGLEAHRGGRYAEALDAFGRVLARFGADKDPELREPIVRTLLNRSLTLHALGRIDEAVADLDAADRAARPSDEPDLVRKRAVAMRRRGAYLSDMGRHGEAAEAYERVIATFGSTDGDEVRAIIARCKVGLAYERLELGDPVEALARVREAMGEGSDLSSVADVGGDLTLAFSVQCRAAELLGDERALREATEEIVEHADGTPEIDEELVAWAMGELVSIRRREGDAAAALEINQRMAHRFSSSTNDRVRARVTRGHVARAHLLGELGRHQDALDEALAFQRSDEHALEDRAGRAWLGAVITDALGELGRPEEALQAVTDLIRLCDPADDDVRGHLNWALVKWGWCLLELGRWDEAIAASTEALVKIDRMSDDDGSLEAEVRMNIAAALAGSQRHTEALARFEELIATHATSPPARIAPMVAKARCERARCLWELEEFDRALLAADEAFASTKGAQDPAERQWAAWAIAGRWWALHRLARQAEARDALAVLEALAATDPSEDVRTEAQDAIEQIREELSGPRDSNQRSSPVSRPGR
jgi:tetratricopeptide (TPR) repeat protein